MGDNENSFNVVVQNEFERVLANPTNVIMSPELKEMLDPEETEQISHEAIMVKGSDGDFTIPCSLRSISSTPVGARIELEVGDANSLMNILTKQEPGFTLEVTHGLNISINDCNIQSWDVFRDIDSFIVGLGVKGEIQF